MLLLTIELKAFARKIAYDFYREIVVLICAVVIVSLFYYIFNDFLNSHIKQISAQLWQQLSLWGHITCSILVSVLIARVIQHRFTAQESILQWLQEIGETGGIRSAYLGISALLLAAAGLSIYNGLAEQIFGPPSRGTLLLEMGLCLLGIAGFAFFRPQMGISQSPLLTNSSNRNRVLLHWRIKQIVFRNQLTQITLLCALVFYFFYLILINWNAPPLILLVMGLIATLFVTSAICIQISEDLAYCWLEKHLGVDHDLYLRTITLICLGFASLSFAFLALPLLLHQQAMSQLSEFLVYLRIPLAHTSPLLLTPLVIFQIDANRPIIPILSAALLSLILATCIFASWLSLGLIPLIFYYAKQSQQNRFYTSHGN